MEGRKRTRVPADKRAGKLVKAVYCRRELTALFQENSDSIPWNRLITRLCASKNDHGSYRVIDVVVSWPRLFAENRNLPGIGSNDRVILARGAEITT